MQDSSCKETIKQLQEFKEIFGQIKHGDDAGVVDGENEVGRGLNRC